MEIIIKLEKRYVTLFLTAVALILLAGLVFAGFDPLVPNPGHPVSQLQKCQNEGDILKMIGGQWACAVDEGGGVAVEVDPTVIENVKDGVSWTEVSNRPAGLDDGDDVGITSESDPQVSSVTSGNWCRGTGSAVTCDRSPPSLSVVEQTCTWASGGAAQWRTCSCPSGYAVTGQYGYNCELAGGHWGCYQTYDYGTSGVQFWHDGQGTAYVGVYCVRLS